MRIGREETRLGAALAARGLVTLPQHWVDIGDDYWPASAYIDLAAPPLAIEVYTSWIAPWKDERWSARAESLIRVGWVVVYLWLRNKATFTDGAVDALLKCHSEVSAAPVRNTYRVIDHDGRALCLGGLTYGELAVDDELFLDPSHTAPKVKCCFPHRFNLESLDVPPAVSLRKRPPIQMVRIFD